MDRKEGTTEIFENRKEMNMKADLNKMKKLLESETGYAISKATGINETTIQRWTSGTTNLKDIKFKFAAQLTELYDKIKGDIKMKKINWKYTVDIDLVDTLTEEQGTYTVVSATTNLETGDTENIIDACEEYIKEEIEHYLDLHGFSEQLGFDEDNGHVLDIIHEFYKENEDGTMDCRLSVYTDENNSEYKPTFYNYDDLVDTDKYTVYCGEVTLTLKP